MAQLSNARRSNFALSRRVADHKRLLMLLGSHDIPRIRRILTIALRKGASIQKILNVVQSAAAGLYSPRGGFTDRELDISFLVKAIGGPKLLYALTKSHGLASDSTVARHHPIPRIRSSISVPTAEDINHNISAFLNPHIKPAPPNALAGNILMFDGIALETKCRYCVDRNHILGLSRETSHRVDTQVTSIENIDTIRTALFNPESDEKKVTFGSDATVVAVAPYARKDHYSPVPIAVSPSDKTEKGAALATWIETTLWSWAEHPNGAAVHGPIWALGSDGDSSFRLAKHLVCMTSKIDPTSPVGKIIDRLAGLNCLASLDGIIGTCDPKHIFKRK